MEEFYLLPSKHPCVWLEICQILRQPIDNIDSLINVIVQLAQEQDSDLKTLRQFFCTNLSDDEVNYFFKYVLPHMITIALEMPILFETGRLCRLTQNTTQSVIFTHQQAACLVAHMFFCTLHKTERNPFWTNYYVWYTCSLDPVIAYLHVIFKFFSKLEKKQIPLYKTICFHRKVQLQDINWRDSNKLLIPVEDKLNGEIGDTEGLLEVDFANKDISFGRGGTQEEIIFGMSPEAGIVVLFVDTLTDKETLLMQGIPRIGKHKGYGLDVKYIGEPDEWNWDNRFIVAMDAIAFSEPDPFDKYPQTTLLKEQIQPQFLLRELTKAYCGFLPPETTEGKTENGKFPSAVATGGWGCGSFSGHPELKAVIQWMAASLADMTKLVYYTFGDEEFSEKFKKFTMDSVGSGATVGELYKFLECIQKKFNMPQQKKFVSLFEKAD